MNAPLDLSRARLLAGGGALVVSFSLSAALGASAGAGEAPRAAGRPGADEPMLDAWIRIDAEGAITVFTGKAELGQGIKTALDPARRGGARWSIRRRSSWSPPIPRRRPNEGYTAGSHSMQDSGTAIRHAAAQARELLIGSGGDALAVAAEQLHAEDGAVIADDGAARRLRRAGRRPAAACRAPSRNRSSMPAEQRRLIGKPMPRVDIPGQGHRRRGLRAGSAPAGHGARARRAAAELWRQAARARYRRGRADARACSRWCATAATSPSSPSASGRRSRRCTRWPRPRNGTRRPKPAGAGHALRHVLQPRRRRTRVGRERRQGDAARHAHRRGELSPAVPDARLDRPVLRGRRCSRTAALTVWTHSQGVYPAARRTRRDARAAGRQDPLHPHGRLGLLRP